MSQAQETQTQSLNIQSSSDSNNVIYTSFSAINDSITLFKMQLNSLQLQLKTLEKTVRKNLKAVEKVADKKNKNKDKTKAKRSPSGFAKPTKVTKELCEFMNRPEGTEIARTEVTKILSEYIKSNKLQEQTENSKNKIVPDDKLKSLLGISSEESTNLTFFNIQKYMNKHFISSKSQPVSESLLTV
jgi:chromatin remodeling complex protein RSC6